MRDLNPKTLEQSMSYRITNLLKWFLCIGCKFYMLQIYANGEGANITYMLDKNKVKAWVIRYHTISTFIWAAAYFVLIGKQLYSPSLNMDKIVLILLFTFGFCSYCILSFFLLTKAIILTSDRRLTSRELLLLRWEGLSVTKLHWESLSVTKFDIAHVHESGTQHYYTKIRRALPQLLLLLLDLQPFFT